MKPAISIWAFPPAWELSACFKLTAASGLAGIELAYAAAGPIQPASTPAEMAALRRQAQATGISISSLASGIFWQVNLLAADPAERQAAKGHIRRMLELAADLEVASILVVPGFVGPAEAGPKVVDDYAAAFGRAVDDFRELAPAAERLGVAIGIENVWNRFLTSAWELRAFLEAVDSPLVGVYLDVANCLREGYPEHWIQLLAGRIKGVHFKDFRLGVGNLAGFVDLLEGDVSFPAVMAALRAAAYRGWVVAEVAPHPLAPASAVRRAALDMETLLQV